MTRRLISAEEMVGKIKAALDARHSSDTLVIARTDAVAVEGFDRAVSRAVSYRDAGADVLFVEAPKTRAELERIQPAVNNVPLIANMVEGGKTPPLKATELEAIGFSLVIFLVLSFAFWRAPRTNFTRRLALRALPNLSKTACTILPRLMTSSAHLK